MTPSKEAKAAAEECRTWVLSENADEYCGPSVAVDFATIIDSHFSALRARLATAEGYLLGLTVDDAAWANHKDCICGECELLRDIRAYLAEAGEGEK